MSFGCHHFGFSITYKAFENMGRVSYATPTFTSSPKWAVFAFAFSTARALPQNYKAVDLKANVLVNIKLALISALNSRQLLANGVLLFIKLLAHTSDLLQYAFHD